MSRSTGFASSSSWKSKSGDDEYDENGEWIMRNLNVGAGNSNAAIRSDGRDWRMVEEDNRWDEVRRKRWENLQAMSHHIAATSRGGT
ncbi:hypothetical protein AAC387_Pa03g3118 [Persea americana]